MTLRLLVTLAQEKGPTLIALTLHSAGYEPNLATVKPCSGDLVLRLRGG